jgi:anti-sigma factor RsiW
MSLGPEDGFAPGELTCQELAELVTDYLEGVLPPRERARFDAHVAECADCTAYVEQMRVTIAVTGRLAGDDITPAVRAALLEAFRGWAAGGMAGR